MLILVRNNGITLPADLVNRSVLTSGDSVDVSAGDIFHFSSGLGELTPGDVTAVARYGYDLKISFTEATNITLNNFFHPDIAHNPASIVFDNGAVYSASKLSRLVQDSVSNNPVEVGTSITSEVDGLFIVGSPALSRVSSNSYEYQFNVIGDVGKGLDVNVMIDGEDINNLSWIKLIGLAPGTYKLVTVSNELLPPVLHIHIKANLHDDPVIQTEKAFSLKPSSTAKLTHNDHIILDVAKGDVRGSSQTGGGGGDSGSTTSASGSMSAALSASILASLGALSRSSDTEAAETHKITQISNVVVELGQAASEQESSDQELIMTTPVLIKSSEREDNQQQFFGEGSKEANSNSGTTRTDSQGDREHVDDSTVVNNDLGTEETVEEAVELSDEGANVIDFSILEELGFTEIVEITDPFTVFGETEIVFSGFNQVFQLDLTTYGAGPYELILGGPDAELFELQISPDGSRAFLSFLKIPEYGNSLDQNFDNVYEISILLNNQFGRNFSIQVPLNTSPEILLGDNLLAVQAGEWVSKGIFNSMDARGLALADIDNDGDLDAMFAALSPLKGFVVWNNEGNGTFTYTGQRFGFEGAFVSDVAAADFDSDGDVDVVLSQEGGTIKYLINNGNGVFSNSGQTIGDRANSRDLLAEDIDNDGDVDIIAGRGQQVTTVYINDGDGNFSNFAQLFNTANRVVGGDFNRDGQFDIITGGDTSIIAYRSNFVTSGNFVVNQTISTNAVTALGLVDLNQDGAADLISATNGGGHQVYLNNGTGTFIAHGSPFYGVGNSVRFAFADVDADGDMDIITAVKNNNRIWLNDGNANFAMGSLYSSSLPNDIAIGTVSVTRELPTANLVLLSPLSGELVDNTESIDTGAVNFVVVAVNGIAANVAVPVQGFYGTIIVNRDGSYSYTIDTNTQEFISLGRGDVGTDSYTYILTDGVTVIFDTLTLTVQGFNDAPTVAAPLSVIISEDQTTGNAFNLLSGASDPDSDPLGVVVTQTSGDTTGIVLSGTSINYIANYYEQLQAGQNEVINLQYDIVDGQGGGVSQTAKITITGLNDAPQARDDNVIMQVGGNTDAGSAIAISHYGYFHQVAKFDLSTFGDGPYDLVLSGPDAIRFYTSIDSIAKTAGLYFLEQANENKPIDVNFDNTYDVTLELNQSYGVTLAITVEPFTYPDAILTPVVGDTDIVINDNLTGALSLSQSTTTGVQWAQALGDIDNDGDLDLMIIGRTTTDGITVWKNDGSGTFFDTGQKIIFPGYNTFDMQLVDIDYDGDLDAVVTSFDQELHLIVNDGTGVFSDGGELGFRNRHAHLNLTDIEKDGDVDLITQHQITGVTVSLNDGMGGFVQDSSPLARSVSVAHGDVNKDGYEDIVVTTTNSIIVYYNDFINSGKYIVAANIPVPVSSPQAIELVDLNGDGFLDIYGQAGRSNYTTVYLSDFGAKFEAISLEFGVSDSGSLYDFGDFNNDGYLDILHKTGYGNNFIMLNDGTGTNYTIQTLPSTTPIDVDVADLDLILQAQNITLNPINSIPGLIIGNILSNDNDVDNTISDYRVLTINGLLPVNDVFTIDGDYGQLIVNIDGSYIYTTDENNLDVQNIAALGPLVESFSYLMSDGATTNPLESSATLTITINNGNLAPVVDAPLLTSFSENAGSTQVANLLVGVSDPNGDSVIVENTHLLEGNDVGVNLLGTVVIQVDPSAYKYLAEGEVERIVYEYNVNDTKGGLVTNTATFEITGVNDAPMAIDDLVIIKPNLLLANGGVIPIETYNDFHVIARFNLNDFGQTYQNLTLRGEDSKLFRLNLDENSNQVILSFRERPSFELPRDADLDNYYNVTVVNNNFSRDFQIHVNTLIYPDAIVPFVTSTALVYENINTDGNLAIGQSTSIGENHRFSIGDIDNDGDLDTVFSHGTTGVGIWKNDGAGILVDTLQSLPLGGTFVLQTTLADLDGDGDLDLVISPRSGFLHISLNDGNGNFSTPEKLTLFSIREGQPFVADFDNDGDVDILVAKDQAGSKLLLNDGLGNFSLFSQTLPSLAGSAAADIDLDGDIDIALGAYNSGVLIYSNDLDGSGQFIHTDTVNLIGSSLVDFADLNNDSYPDLVIANFFHFAVYINNAGTGFTQSWFSSSINSASGVDFADFNNDGFVDIYAAGEFDYILLNDGAGVFSILQQVNSARNSGDVALLDIDNSVVAPTVTLGSLLLGQEVITANVFGNDLDIDSDPDNFTVTAINNNHAWVDQPVFGDYGTLILQADGDYTYVVDTSDPAVIALSANDTLNDSFTYQMNDGDTINPLDSSATLTITISGNADAAVAGTSQYYLFGTPNDDYLMGSVEANLIEAGQGNDVLDGGEGTPDAPPLIAADDILNGGAGDDIMIFDVNDQTKVDGGNGIDSAQVHYQNQTIYLHSDAPAILPQINLMNTEILDLTPDEGNNIIVDALALYAATDENHAFTINASNDTTNTVQLENTDGWLLQSLTPVSSEHLTALGNIFIHYQAAVGSEMIDLYLHQDLAVSYVTL